MRNAGHLPSILCLLDILPKKQNKGSTLYQNANIPLSSTLAKLAETSDQTIEQIAQSENLTQKETGQILAFFRHIAPYQTNISSTFNETRKYLVHALTAIKKQHYQEASQLAIEAYLEGVEPRETTLNSISPSLVGNLEQAFAELRVSIQKQQSASVIEQHIFRINILLDTAEEYLRTNASNWVAFCRILFHHPPRRHRSCTHYFSSACMDQTTRFADSHSKTFHSPRLDPCFAFGLYHMGYIRTPSQSPQRCNTVNLLKESFL